MSQKGMRRRDLLRTAPAVGLGFAGVSGTVRATSTEESGTELEARDATATADSEPLKQSEVLFADDGEFYDEFGSSIAMAADGKTAIVGAMNDKIADEYEVGSAYVFTQSDGAWQQQQKLTADDGDKEDTLGSSVALSADGTTAIVGAPGDTDPNGYQAGSAYVFEQENGNWQQTQKLTPADGDVEDEFGSSVGLSADGTTAIIGARFDNDPNGDEAGSAYVFTQENGTWSQQQKLAAKDGDSDDQFGKVVTLSGDGTTAIIGAYTDEDPNGEEAGSAYVFEYVDGVWQQQQKLTASDGDEEDFFGDAIALSADGTRAIIGASLDEDPNGGDAGSAYVFEYADGSWHETQKLIPDDGDAKDEFGSAVTLSADGNKAIIGAEIDADPHGPASGSAYVFEYADGQWEQKNKLTAAAGNKSDNFGTAVTLSSNGDTALIGSPNAEHPNGLSTGAAYIFEEGVNAAPTANTGIAQLVRPQTTVTLNGSFSSDPNGDQLSFSWEQIDGPSVTLEAADTATPTFTAPAVENQTDLVFELTVDDGTVTDSDTVTVTVEETPPLRRMSKLAASDGDSEDSFGSGIALSGDGTTAVIGAPKNYGSNGYKAGAAYVFERSDGNWQEQAKLTAQYGDTFDSFGVAVALSADGTTAVIGADEDEDPNGEKAGSAYVFERSGENWRQVTKLAADDGEKKDDFGSSIALSADGTTTLISAPSDESSTDSFLGSVYVFERDGDGWDQTAKLTASDDNEVYSFGDTVAVSADGTTAMVGAPDTLNDDGVRTGMAYVFERTGNTWEQVHTFVATDVGDRENFGNAIEMTDDGTVALIGAKWHDAAGVGSGLAYIFEQSGDSWDQAGTIRPVDFGDAWRFGMSVAMSGDGSTAIISAMAAEDSNGEIAGSVYRFMRSDDGWQQSQKLVPSDVESGDWFGSSLDISADGSTVLGAAPDDDEPNGENAGSASVFIPSTGPPPLSDTNPPRDLDGDGRYEDVNGDGTFDVFDVQALFDNLDHNSVQNNPQAFNFSGDSDPETVDIFDVQALFDTLQNEE